MIELVTFDWNGTIFADTQLTVEATNYEIQLFGGQPLPRRELVNGFYFPVIDFLCDQGCNREALKDPASAEKFHQYYEARAGKCRTRSGVRKVLDWNEDHSVDSIILSNHINSAIEAQLDRLGLTQYFDAVLANEEYTASSQGNNKVQRLINYLANAEQDPAKALIVGDSPEDIGIGKDLGMVTVALKDGFFPTAKLRASNPDYFIGNLGKLVEILEEHS